MKTFLYLMGLQLLSLIATGQVTVQNPLCENLSNPIGLDIRQPRFSWQLISDKRNVMQSAYEIRVGNDPTS